MLLKFLLRTALATSVFSFLVVCLFIGRRVLDDGSVEHPPPVVIDVPEEEPPSLDDAVSLIVAKDIRADVEYLASPELEGRMSGKRGNVKAAQFIEQRLADLGLPTMRDRFSISRINEGPNRELGDGFSENVYAWIEGIDEVIVIGAHFDHIGWGPRLSRVNQVAIHPGADDNASGTAGVLAIAQAFALLQDQVHRTIVFQLYSGEELGLLGSRHYCVNPKFPLDNPSMDKHILMINLDMIGNFRGSTRESIVENRTTLDYFISELNTQYPGVYSIMRRGAGAGGGSDHVSFHNRGVPVIFFFTGLTPEYHTPQDTPDRLNYDGCEIITRYAFALAWLVSQADDIDIQRTTDIIESQYDHELMRFPK